MGVLAATLEAIDGISSAYRKHWEKKYPSTVKFLPGGFVLKGSPARGVNEGDVVRFIRRQTSIPVPRVIAAAQNSRAYFLMRRVPGDPLDLVWAHLDSKQRANIVRQLHHFISELRTLSSPHGGAVCGLNNSVCKDGRVRSLPFGPFPDESAFNDHLIRAAEPFMDETQLPGIRAQMVDSHRIVFTHGDLAPRNIMVKGDVVTGIIDWEHSGWYPEHWEYIKALYAPMMSQEGKEAAESWKVAVKEIIAVDYERELAVDMRMTSQMQYAL
ncbi:kinase-like protein [Stereum hirsutum FP-91666 SS1]|uniref:kinase-like protein n=1 Tax=Stereum hirsutum (strain FP-91666) TaxID=721885 RepID=UPI000444961C|nr:kinase-like protein [Stereum hirsutum FP-91666 SS1]EIM81361.1 kinase-like protein [Stereum hirsutum FP-91666 SS1]